MSAPERNHSVEDFEAQLRALNRSREEELSFDKEGEKNEVKGENEFYTDEFVEAFFSQSLGEENSADESAGEAEPVLSGEASPAAEAPVSEPESAAPVEEAPVRRPRQRSAAPAAAAAGAGRGRKRPPEGRSAAKASNGANASARPRSANGNAAAKPRPTDGSTAAKPRSADGNVPAAARESNPPKRRSFHFFRFLGRTLKVILSTVLVVVVALIGAIIILTHGPSEDACRLFVLSANETSALKFVPSLFLPAEKVNAILYPEKVETAPDTFVELSFESAAAADEPVEPQELVQISEETVTDELEVVDIREKTFKGKMLIIHDPTRVRLCSINDFGIGFGNYGIYLTDFIAKSGAIAGTNAGGFYDPNGQGNGGIPDGIVIREGAIAYGSPYSQYVDVIGFDAGHVMHVGDMTGQQALDAGIVEGLSFAAGPVLIENGVKRTGLGGGVNPRTCIGQRSDGTVLLMVVEGRHPDSLGATYDDLADLMEEYGAVNAGNLDGGSSSAMIYNGEQITKGSTIIGSRTMCTAILVMP